MAKSFKIRGIEPADLATYPTGVKKQYWGWVVEFGLKRKDKELSQGLDKDGKPLRPISATTRKHRRSAMTPSGKGSPTAPPLTPAFAKSRTRSLLDGRALSSHAEFWWRYDVFTGDQWGAVLEHQAKQGRDVFGLSEQGTSWVQGQALKRWEAYKAGRPVKERQRAARPVYDIGESGVRSRGAMTAAELKAHLTEEKAVTIPGRPKQLYPRLLAHIWGEAGPSAGKAGKIGVKPPKPGPIVTRVAMAKVKKPAAPKVPPTFEQALAGRMKEAVFARERDAAVIDTINEYAGGAYTVAKHGMTTPETFKSVEFWGINWHFTGTIDKAHPETHPMFETVRQFGHQMARKKLPDRLVEATKSVYFTSQKNKDDAYYLSKPEMVKAGFTEAAATGGDNDVVVYSNRSLSLGLFSHESGHNLAKHTYGSITPAAASDYAKLVKTSTEPPVSRYATANIAEDFAEAVRLFVENPVRMRKDHPERFKIIERIMKEPSYGG